MLGKTKSYWCAGHYIYSDGKGNIYDKDGNFLYNYYELRDNYYKRLETKTVKQGFNKYGHYEVKKNE